MNGKRPNRKRNTRYNDRSGQVIGDYRLLKRIDGKNGRVSYLVKCEKCGFERTLTLTTILNGKMVCKCGNTTGKCRVCGKEFPKGEQRYFCSDGCRTVFFHKLRGKPEKNKKRKITNTTRMLICVYTAEGMKPSEIADALYRDEKTVKHILTVCKKNGKYQQYIDNSPVLQVRKRKCT